MGKKANKTSRGKSDIPDKRKKKMNVRNPKKFFQSKDDVLNLRSHSRLANKNKNKLTNMNRSKSTETDVSTRRENPRKNKVANLIAKYDDKPIDNEITKALKHIHDSANSSSWSSLKGLKRRSSANSDKETSKMKKKQQKSRQVKHTKFQKKEETSRFVD